MLDLIKIVAPLIKIKDKVRIISYDMETHENVLTIFLVLENVEQAEELMEALSKTINNLITEVKRQEAEANG